MSEIGWLVEKKCQEDKLHLWFAGVNGDFPGYKQWTRDPNKPIRFARKEDAELFIKTIFSDLDTLLKGWPIDAGESLWKPFASEHMWTGNI